MVFRLRAILSIQLPKGSCTRLTFFFFFSLLCPLPKKEAGAPPKQELSAVRVVDCRGPVTGHTRTGKNPAP